MTEINLTVTQQEAQVIYTCLNVALKNESNVIEASKIITPLAVKIEDQIKNKPISNEGELASKEEDEAVSSQEISN